jgi:dynein heavy chain
MQKLELARKDGGWVMLQNIHLMPRWLIELEKKLDDFNREGGGSNPNFRLFLSAEPSTGIPIGILDRSIKLTNEPPAGLKANIKRAWIYFPKEEIDEKDNKMKCILWGLCFFHSTVIERRRFGPKGWNMSYPFNIGDLRDSYSVLNKYFESPMGKIPWDDLAYIFGEIMYGGHIVDDWDRRLAKAYLEVFMMNELFDEIDLFPFCEGKNVSFKCPPLGTTHDKYSEYIETGLFAETPLAYGLHPNAEIGFRTAQCQVLFSTLLELAPRDVGKGGDDAGGNIIRSKNDIVLDTIKQVLEDFDLRAKVFAIEDIKTRIPAEDKGPYQNVFIQECEYMNYLLLEVIKSLEETKQGFDGLLTISEQMEQLIDAVALDRVPATWTKLAYPSKRGLASWLMNLLKRIEQLSAWKDDPIAIPKVTIVSRLFNPQSFLTAIKQVIGKKSSYPLNKLMIATEITKKSIEEIEGSAKDGAYIFGLVLEGARWDVQGGFLDESRPKEMFFLLPVVYAKAIMMPAEGKEEKGVYQCPAYKTEDRGSTFVFTAQLKTKHNPRKWILGGVALLMDVESVNEEAGQKKKA